MTHYIIKVSEAELDVVRLALGRMVEGKPVAEPRAKRELFTPTTGNDQLDAFMRASYEKNGPKKAPRKPTTPKFPYGLKAMNAAGKRSLSTFNEAALAAWKSQGYTVEVTPLSNNDKSAALDGRNVRVLHNNP